MTDTPTPPHRAESRFPIGPLVAVAIVVGATVALLGIGHLRHAKSAVNALAPCGPAMELSRKLAPQATGEVASLTMASKPRRMPDLAFLDGEGQPMKLSDWKGKTVLLNLWATWCVPCRTEMPALDRLQGKLGGDKFAVVAINIDTRDSDKPKAFLKDANLTHLGNFHDEKASVFQELKSVGMAVGMPTSVLIDGQGCELGNMAGPAEWDSEDAIKLINAAVGS
ncbi:thioredoxin-like protein [Nitrobacter winogradskyi Nb-255]|uniref:Thioredoxin-like protein n=1 Tax=Nitrobacter winogradskyi (strain ATCC 25391 / DSM 10237 / CIP 104748 / NCIMB 11846 / Nb-255) TaxID=323098 RepID=Q3SUQ9_NITWN|nr:TlpA disulfide reductase family protein [Nitrobacter winogradskyi]ABA03982.1 thioredoxin-like protein [Nitrobacter winogradskyi Nb-255]